METVALGHTTAPVTLIHNSTTTDIFLGVLFLPRQTRSIFYMQISASIICDGTFLGQNIFFLCYKKQIVFVLVQTPECVY